MTVRWIDGFEAYENITPLVGRYELAVVTGTAVNAPTSTTVEGRMGYGHSLYFTGLTFVTPYLTNQSTWVVGFAFYNAINSPTSYSIFELRDGTAAGISLQLDLINHVFGVWNGGILIAGGTTSETIVQNNTWYHVQLKVVIGASGSVLLKVNDIQYCTGTGDTRPNNGSTTANRVAFVKPEVNSPQHYRVDDLYILDNSGTSNTDFLGDMKIEAITTIAPGPKANFTSSQANVPNWVAVSGHDNLYVSSNVDNAEDIYKFSPLTNVAGDIKALALHVYGRNTDGEIHNLKGVVFDQTESLSTDSVQVCDISGHFYSFNFNQNPILNSAWTVEDVNSTYFGFKLLPTTP